MNFLSSDTLLYPLLANAHTQHRANKFLQKLTTGNPSFQES